MYKLKKIAVYICKSYALDFRALGLMRIATGLIVIVDLLIRGSDLSAHYTGEGMWPVHLIKTFGWNTGFWSLHALSDNYWWEFFLFSVHFFFAFFLLIGFKTKFSTFIVWALLISLHNRNLFILQSGDDVLRLLLFWGLFLPWSNCYSVDSVNVNYRPKQNNIANLGYLLFISSIYFFTVCLKSSPEWHDESTAIYYALSLEQLRLPIGEWLYNYPSLMKLLTRFVFYLELVIPFLILFPAKKGYLRLIAFILLLLLHIGIGLTLYVGLFYIINIISSIALIPSCVLNKLQGKFRFFKTSVARGFIQMPSKFSKAKQLVFNYFLSSIIIFCLFINLSFMNWFNYQLKSEFYYPVHILRLNQYWGMFSPSILKKDGWFVYYGIDSLGRQWDLYRNQDYVDFSKPKRIVSMYKTDRWRKLAENMQSDNFTFLRPLYGTYILKQWNKQHPNKKMITLNLYYMTKQNLPNYQTTVPEKKLYTVSIDN
ncbi:MAG: hypothetical protein SFY56_14375 [Bacteroidota bacterium]|nr:hypothetical protein [Bacteroidota bacterium]